MNYLRGAGLSEILVGGREDPGMLKEEVALELRFESEIIEETSVCRGKIQDMLWGRSEFFRLAGM